MDLQLFMSLLYKISGVCLCLFRGGEPQFCCPRQIFLPSVASMVFAKTGMDEQSSSLVIHHFWRFGYIKLPDSDNVLFVGPCFERAPTRREARAMLDFLSLDIGLTDEFLSTVTESIVSALAFDSCMQLLQCNILGENVPQQMETATNKPSGDTPSDEDTQSNVADFEYKFLACIEDGRPEEMADFINLRQMYGMRVASVSDSSLRSIKNMLIGANALSSRAAMSGGLNYNIALALSSHYIRSIENVLTEAEAMPLLLAFTTDYAERVKRAKTQNISHPLVASVVKEVGGRVGDKVTVAEIAVSLGINRSYLSRQFKKLTGEGLHEYIIRMKIEEAKHLLKSTELTLAQISEQLCFSSTEHMQATFKRVAGVTPGSYKAAL